MFCLLLPPLPGLRNIKQTAAWAPPFPNASRAKDSLGCGHSTDQVALRHFATSQATRPDDNIHGKKTIFPQTQCPQRVTIDIYIKDVEHRFTLCPLCVTMRKPVNINRSRAPGGVCCTHQGTGLCFFQIRSDGQRCQAEKRYAGNHEHTQGVALRAP